jgi:hypothetical protein
MAMLARRHTAAKDIATKISTPRMMSQRVPVDSARFSQCVCACSSLRSSFRMVSTTRSKLLRHLSYTAGSQLEMSVDFEYALTAWCGLFHIAHSPARCHFQIERPVICQNISGQLPSPDKSDYQNWPTARFHSALPSKSYEW